ncbi:MAG: hypothetical protein CL489_08290 [Acidobacteria bacterium]|nr:hypothetical protein [Acidobacteriota bacterium]|tara:strand:+ start:19338 stop:19994 length:657 start_codon:yes stop_codon:yes gene_type:complete
MKISNDTLVILKNFSKIQPCILLKEGSRINTMSLDKNQYAHATIPDKFDQNMGIYDLKEFLATLSLIDEPEIEVESDGHEIKISDGRSTCFYELSDERIISTPNRFVDLEDDAFDVHFDLKFADLAKVMKAAENMKLKWISVLGENGKLFLKAFDKNNERNNEFLVEIGTFDGDDFQAIMNISYLDVINLDYRVSVKKDSKIRLENPAVTYIVALEVE